jgi:hypothetical protein
MTSNSYQQLKILLIIPLSLEMANQKRDVEINNIYAIFAGRWILRLKRDRILRI